MSHNDTLEIDRFVGLRSWLEERIGYELEQSVMGKPVVLPNSKDDSEPLLAFKIGNCSVMRVRPEWVDSIQRIVDGLAFDELFSVFGAYELARVTLPDGIGVWGPSWYFVGDEANFVAAPTEGVVQLSKGETDALADKEIFWHCSWQSAIARFGVVEDGKLIALATVHERGKRVYEFDVDVAPASGRRGLGRAVVSAAGQWILQQDRLILATTAPWNIPSARLLHSIGLKYVLSNLAGHPEPFRVPPQPLGKPLPNTDLYHHYPDWAVNKEIQPRLS